MVDQMASVGSGPLCATATKLAKWQTYLSRSTNVMFSAISATRFAIREAMIVYGDACCWSPFVAPLAVLCVFCPAVEAAFLGREAAAFVRLTGADATEAGILTLEVEFCV